MKQIRLFKDINPKAFGSDLNLGKRKEKRPISLKTPMHLILKSNTILQHGSFKGLEGKIIKLIHEFADQFHIRIFVIAVHHNHIHLLILTSARQGYISFVRALNGTMVKKLGLPSGLFDLPPYTRIVGWGREFEIVKEYIIRNQYEADGKTDYFEALRAK